MGAAQSNQRASWQQSLLALAAAVGVDRLEKRIDPATGNNWNRRSAV